MVGVLRTTLPLAFAAILALAALAWWARQESESRSSFLLFGEWGRGSPIVLPEDATDEEREAAKLVASTLAAAAGGSPSRFPIVTETAWPRRAIYLGATERAAALAPFARPSPLVRPVGFTIRPDAVIVRAAEREDAIFAASVFLEREIKARWFMPGRLGLETSRSALLKLAATDCEDSGAYYSRDLGDTGDSLVGRPWKQANRLRSFFSGGHTASELVPPALMRRRPQFAPWLNGAHFLPESAAVTNWQPNLLAEGLADHVADEFSARFRTHPKRWEGAFGLNDTYRFDQSARTLAAVLPEKFFRRRPDYSDLLFGFLNEVAGKLKPQFPDKFVTTYAYDWTENTPRFPVAENVMPFLTADRSMWFDPEFAANDRDLIERWGKAGPKFFGLYDYYYGAPFLVPRPTLWAVTDPIPYAYEKGARAFYAEATPNWALDGPKAWLAAQLLWNAKLDSAKLLDEYYTRFWKESAGPMRAFYELCDQQWREQPKPPVWVKYLKDDDQRRLFPPAVREQLRKHLNDAAATAKAAIVRERVKFVSDAFRVSEAFCLHDEVREELQRLAFDSNAATTDLLSGYARYGKARDEFIREYRHIRQTSALAIQTASIDDYLRNDPRGRVVDVIAQRGELPLLPAAAMASHFAGRAPTASVLLSPGRELLDDPGWRTLSVKKVHPFTLTDWVEQGPWGGKTEPTEFRRIDLSRNPDGTQRLRYSGCNQETLWQWKPAQPGHLYRARVRAKGHVAPGSMVYLLVPFIDQDGQHLGAGHIDRLPAGDWPDSVELEILVRAPAKAAQIGVSLRTLYQVQGDWAEWESLSLRELGP